MSEKHALINLHLFIATGHSNNIRPLMKKTNAALLTSTKTVDESKTTEDVVIVFNGYSQAVSYTVLTVLLTLINCTFA